MTRKTRRKIGGSIWNSDIKRIKSQVSLANQSCKNMLRLIQGNKNVLFSNAIIIYLGNISTALTTILEAINSLEATAKDFQEEQDEPQRHGLDDVPAAFYEDVEDE